MTKKWLSSIVVFAVAGGLLFSLFAVACAPKAPVGEVVPKEQLTKAQADLAAEKQKTAASESKAKDLEAQLAAVQKPAQVYRWAPSTWNSTGSPWDNLVYMAEYLDKMSDGRIEITPSKPGAICPVEEQAEAVSAGTTAAMAITPPYYPGKIPAAYMVSTVFTVNYVHELADLLEVYRGGRANEIWKQLVEEHFNVEHVARVYLPVDMIIASNKPIYGVADLKGVKFRCGDENVAAPLTAFGASTVWFPGTEIYTGMATGVVDAFTYDSAYGDLSNSFNEVSKYWIRKPVGFGPAADSFIVNRDVWNGMPDDLKEMVKVAIQAASNRITYEGYARIADAWSTVQEQGIKVIEWSQEDQKTFRTKQLELAWKFSTDPDFVELMNIVESYSKMMGFIE